MVIYMSTVIACLMFIFSSSIKLDNIIKNKTTTAAAGNKI